MLYTLANFNAFRDFAHNASRSAGWWNESERYFDDGPGAHDNHTMLSEDKYVIPTKLCLIHSEISEAYDGYMTGANDDHLPQYPSALVEFGDVLLRIGDMAGYLDIDMTSAIMMVLQADHIHIGPLGWLHYRPGDQTPVGTEGWFNVLHCFTSAAMEGFRKNSKDNIIPALPAMNANLARIVILCDLIASKNEWNLPEATAAKAAYNAIRPDHKAEVRALADGKTF